MTSMSQLSWATLPTFVLPEPPRIASNPSTSTHTTPWSAGELPPSIHAPRRKYTDPELIPRLLKGLETGLQRMRDNGTLSDESVFSRVKVLLESAFLSALRNEDQVGSFTHVLLHTANQIASKILQVYDEPPTMWKLTTPTLRWSQKGSIQFFKERLANIAVECKSYSVALSKAKAWTENWVLDPEKQAVNGPAIAIKVALQMASSVIETEIEAETRFGLVTGGCVASVLELVPSVKDEHGNDEGTNLLTSDFFCIASGPLPDLITGQPVQADNVSEAQPLLGLLVAMMCSHLKDFEVALPSPETFLQETQVFNPPENLKGEQEDPEGDDKEDKNNKNCKPPNQHNQEGGQGTPAIRMSTHNHAQMTISYDNPNLSPLPRILHRIAFPVPDPAALRNIPIDASSKQQPLTSTSHLVTRLHTLLGDGRDGRVWQGTVSASGMVIAVKTLENKEIALCEAKFYEHAPETISHLIPKYFGTYVRPDESWFAIVMEDVGVCLEKELGIDWYEVREKLGFEAWTRLGESVKEFHRAGFHHGDLEPRNVSRQSDGSFRFYDFSYAKQHQCGGAKKCGELAVFGRY